jgi:hypothetical protein
MDANASSFHISPGSPGNFPDSSFLMTSSGNLPGSPVAALGTLGSAFGSQSGWQETEPVPGKGSGSGGLMRGNLLEEESQTLGYSFDRQPASAGLNSSYRGTAKPLMGHPVSIGKTTQQLTDKGMSIQQLAREKERELFGLTHHLKSSAPASSPSPSSSMRKEKQSPSPGAGAGPLESSSQWKTMKASLLQKTPHSSDKKRDRAERAERLEKRSRPWPVAKKEHYEMEYSWLAQPMVTEAARQVYAEEKERERERAEEEKKRRQEEKEKEKRLQRTLLQKVKKYNPQEVSEISSLRELKEFEKETALKIREERLNAKPIQHPYGWAMPPPNG